MTVISVESEKGKEAEQQLAKWLCSAYLSGAGRFITAIVPNARTETLLPIIEERVTPDSIVYTDTFKAYNALDVTEFHRMRINHFKLFDRGNHINGIENFWNQAKRNLRRCNGIKPNNFHWFLKECEWHVNGGNHQILYKHLKLLAFRVKALTLSYFSPLLNFIFLPFVPVSDE
jgi:transposase